MCLELLQMWCHARVHPQRWTDCPYKSNINDSAIFSFLPYPGRFNNIGFWQWCITFRNIQIFSHVHFLVFNICTYIFYKSNSWIVLNVIGMHVYCFHLVCGLLYYVTVQTNMWLTYFVGMLRPCSTWVMTGDKVKRFKSQYRGTAFSIHTIWSSFRSNQPPIQDIPVVLSLGGGCMSHGMQLNSHFHLLLSWRMGTTVTTITHSSSSESVVFTCLFALCQTLVKLKANFILEQAMQAKQESRGAALISL